MARLAQFETLGAGQVLYHVHPARFAAIEFNPHTTGGRSRFSPWCTPDGKPIPSWYASLSSAGALYETVFRHVAGQADRTVYRASLAEKCLSAVQLSARLKLLQLRGAGLLSLGLRSSLTTTTPERYRQTARVAKVLHAWYPEAQGLVWQSRINNMETSIVLFGDRVDSQNFARALESRSLDGDVVSHVIDAASRIGCVIA